MKHKEIKILLVAAFPPPPGGDSTWALNYREELKKRNYYYDFVNTSVIGKRSESVDDKSNLWTELKRSFRIWRSLKFKLKTFKPDIIHLNTNVASKGIIRDYISVLICKAKKIPVVTHCHTNVGFKIEGNKIANYFFSKIVSASHKVIVLNNQSKKYTDRFGKDKTVIIPNFIDSSILITKPKSINTVLKDIVFVGHLKKEKGIEEILKVSGHFKNINFTLVGPKTDDYKYLTTNDNLIITGPVNYEEVLSYLDRSDLFIFPSYSEGFSIALLEAMARGLPVIATDVGANHEAIENMGGIIVSPKNVDEIIKAIETLASVDARESASKWNLSKIKNSYVLEKIFDQILEIYCDILCA